MLSRTGSTNKRFFRLTANPKSHHFGFILFKNMIYFLFETEILFVGSSLNKMWTKKKHPFVTIISIDVACSWLERDYSMQMKLKENRKKMKTISH